MPTKVANFRLGEEDVARILAIAEARGGLTKTRVVQLAVERLHREVCGRRVADERPVRVRPAGVRKKRS